MSDEFREGLIVEIEEGDPEFFLAGDQCVLHKRDEQGFWWGKFGDCFNVWCISKSPTDHPFRVVGDATAKSPHIKLLECVKLAIKNGDWQIDGACDPTPYIEELSQ